MDNRDFHDYNFKSVGYMNQDSHFGTWFSIVPTPSDSQTQVRAPTGVQTASHGAAPSLFCPARSRNARKCRVCTRFRRHFCFSASSRVTEASLAGRLSRGCRDARRLLGKFGQRTSAGTDFSRLNLGKCSRIYIYSVEAAAEPKYSSKTQRSSHDP
jgi:hypothetical protein